MVGLVFYLPRIDATCAQLLILLLLSSSPTLAKKHVFKKKPYFYSKITQTHWHIFLDLLFYPISSIRRIVSMNYSG